MGGELLVKLGELLQFCIKLRFLGSRIHNATNFIQDASPIRCFVQEMLTMEELTLVRETVEVRPLR